MMKRPTTNADRPHKGFTLIEVLVAVALAGTLMMAATWWLVALMQAWGTRNSTHDFSQHCEGVRYFLSTLASEANPPTSSASITSRVTWETMPGDDELATPTLTFRINKLPALLSTGRDATPETIVHLIFAKDEGVSLGWHAANLTPEEADSNDSVKRIAVSPYVSMLEYGYYRRDKDPGEWEINAEPNVENERYIVPDLLIFTFTDPSTQEKRFVSVFLPIQAENAPIF